MDVKAYKEQLEEYTTKYKTWWCIPYEKFLDEYFKEREVPPRGRKSHKEFMEANKNFRKNLRQRSDLPSQIYSFLDLNYEIYINATPEQCENIRQVISNSFYKSHWNSLDNYMYDLLFEYITEWTSIKLTATGDKTWLVRSLVAISLENCSVDYRDTLISLADLYIIAEKKKINPSSEFKNVANLSSHEVPRGGSIPMNLMMATIRDTALYREKTKKFLGLF